MLTIPSSCINTYTHITHICLGVFHMWLCHYIVNNTETIKLRTILQLGELRSVFTLLVAITQMSPNCDFCRCAFGCVEPLKASRKYYITIYIYVCVHVYTNINCIYIYPPPQNLYFECLMWRLCDRSGESHGHCCWRFQWIAKRNIGSWARLNIYSGHGWLGTSTIPFGPCAQADDLGVC